MLNVDQAADFLGISTETIRILARNKRIPAAKIGRLWRFSEQDLTNFIRSQYDVQTTRATDTKRESDVHQDMAVGVVHQ
jgi:excisionase family DNA binding protein